MHDRRLLVQLPQAAGWVFGNHAVLFAVVEHRCQLRNDDPDRRAREWAFNDLDLSLLVSVLVDRHNLNLPRVFLWFESGHHSYSGVAGGRKSLGTNACLPY